MHVGRDCSVEDPHAGVWTTYCVLKLWLFSLTVTRGLNGGDLVHDEDGVESFTHGGDVINAGDSPFLGINVGDDVVDSEDSITSFLVGYDLLAYQ